MPKIIHYREQCIGCNACVENAPSYWEIDEKDGKANLKNATKKGDTYVLDVTEVEIEQNENARDDCPVSIIRLLDDTGHEIQ